MEVLKNQVKYKLGNHIDTDVITPGKYLTSYEPEYLGSICLTDVYPDFPEMLRGGGFVVGGINFGCGSSRETAPIALKACGVKAIIAEEFSRIFYRNAWNIGLPVIICEGIAANADPGDVISVFLDDGLVVNETKNVTLKCAKIPDLLMNICQAGGLIEYLKNREE